MITQLTPEQEAQLKIYAQKWRDIALSTEPANRTEAESGVKLAYKLAGLDPPQQIIWCDSPYQLLKDTPEIDVAISHPICHDLLKPITNRLEADFITYDVWKSLQMYFYQHVEKYLYTVGWKSISDALKYSDFYFNKLRLLQSVVMDVYRYACFDYAHQALGLKQPFENLSGLFQVAYHAGYWIPYNDICFISERPDVYRFDQNHELHCENDVALGYPDGWGVYAIHGKIVPEDVVMQPESITPDHILKQENIDIVHAMTDFYGLDRLIHHEKYPQMQLELTTKQVELFAAYNDKWHHIYLDITPTHHAEAEQSIKLAYQNAGLIPPQQFLWFASPRAMYEHALTLLPAQPIKDTIETEVINQSSALIQQKLRFIFNRILRDHYIAVDHSLAEGYANLLSRAIRPIAGELNSRIGGPDRNLSKYDYVRDAFGMQHETELLQGLFQIAQHAGWWLPYSDVCLISERHTVYNHRVNKRGRKHNEDGHVIGYADGWGVYVWDSVAVPEYVVKRPQDITLDKIRAEKDPQIVEVMIKRYGIEKVIRDGGFTIESSGDDTDLYRIEFANGNDSIKVLHWTDLNAYGLVYP